MEISDGLFLFCFVSTCFWRLCLLFYTSSSFFLSFLLFLLSSFILSSVSQSFSLSFSLHTHPLTSLFPSPHTHPSLGSHHLLRIHPRSFITLHRAKILIPPRPSRRLGAHQTDSSVFITIANPITSSPSFTSRRENSERSRLCEGESSGIFSGLPPPHGS